MRFGWLATASVVFAASAAAARAQGLEATDGGPVRTEIAHVQATIEAGVAHVEVDETFRNATATVREGVWKFRLPEDAVIGSFSMWMEGKEKQGAVVEAQRARATYESIVRSKRDPGLLEQTGWREFRVNVFPIPANDTVRVRMRYAHVVRDDLGLETVEIPLPQKGGPVGDLRVRVRVADSSAVSAVESPSHPKATVTRGEGGFEVAWGADGEVPTGPFVVRTIPRRDGFGVSLLAHRPAGAAEGWFVARVVPRLAEPPRIARDVVFVVDRSGSMSGVKIEQARAALLYGLSTLKPGDRFDVISFASDVATLGERGLLPADEESLARARRAASELSASGGTNIAGALEAALARRTDDASRLFAVVFLTDGMPTVGVTDSASILAQWRAKSAGRARLFAFGVGDDVKDYLLSKLAAEGRGDARYVRAEETLEVKLAALFDRVRTPLLLDPSLETTSEAVQVLDAEPQRLPDLFQGRALVVAGRFKGAGPAVLRLRGRTGGESVSIDVPVAFPAETPARPHVAQIWAKTRVERLLDDVRVLGSNAEIRAEVLRLGLEHRLVTPYTSFLVLEEGAKLVDEFAAEPEILRRGGGAAAADGAGAASTADADPGSSGGTSLGVGGGSGRGGGGLDLGGAGFAGGAPLRGAAVAARSSWLALHQSADGSWDANGFTRHCGGFPCGNPGREAGDVAETGLALLALFGSGSTHESGPERIAARNGLLWLRNLQDADGGFGPRGAPRCVRDDAIGASVMIEAYGQTGARALAQAARRALGRVLATRGANHVWNHADGTIDYETTGWMLLAIRRAVRAGFVDETKDAAGLAAETLDGVTDARSGRTPGGPIATAVAQLARAIAAGSSPTGDVASRAAALLVTDPDPDDATVLYFRALAASESGGSCWKDWDVRRAKITADRNGPNTGHRRGSWTPSEQDEFGRVGVTALRSLILLIP